MNLNESKTLWENALNDLLKVKFDTTIINVLSHQTIDSIRRISIYKTYGIKAKDSERLNLPYYHTSNPFTLSQRTSLSINSRIWYIYLATYFGKSNKSKWDIFNKTAFKNKKKLITVEEIESSRGQYYSYLKNIDLFKSSNFSNHRKYTKKSLDGNKGLIHSIEYFLDNIDNYSNSKSMDFNLIYVNAMRIPNFGRMAAFDFTSSLCKCNLNVLDPISMYHQNSTGPLRALKDLLVIANHKQIDKSAQIDFGDNLLNWFINNSDIPIVAQVLEDSICNWQKSPRAYKRYFG